jgi:hypothetical protein
MADDRKHWRPYLEYLQRYGDRRRAEGHEAPDIADSEYWEHRRRNEEMKNQPRKAA